MNKFIQIRILSFIVLISAMKTSLYNMDYTLFLTKSASSIF